MREDQNACAYQEVKESGGIDCPGYSQDRDENEPCGKGTQDGPKCVYSIKHADAPAKVCISFYKIFAENRKRCPHQGGGDKKDDSANGKAQQAESIEREVKILIDETEERLGACNEKRKEQCISADAPFEDTECS